MKVKKPSGIRRAFSCHISNYFSESHLYFLPKSLRIPEKAEEKVSSVPAGNFCSIPGKQYAVALWFNWVTTKP